MNFRTALLAVPALLLVACAAETNDTADQADEQDLTKNATSVSLESSDNGKTFLVEEGKKVIVNLTYGGFVASPYGKYDVTTVDKSFGQPTITVKTPHIPDAPTTEKLTWETGVFSHAGETHHVVLTAKSLTGGKAKTFTFTAKIVAKKSSGAQAGQTCGGFGGIPCASGLDCDMGSGPMHPDQAGTCRVRQSGAPLGGMCGGIAGLRCQDGLDCEMAGNHPDESGTCAILN